MLKAQPSFNKQNSTSYYEMTHELQSAVKSIQQSLLDKMDGTKSNNYIVETYKKWRALYIRALGNKNMFVKGN